MAEGHGSQEQQEDQGQVPTSPHNHNGKKSIMLKVKDKALKWRHMITKKHGHHKNNEEAKTIPLGGVHEDNNGGEQDPEFHGAPMYESERSPKFYTERSSRQAPNKPDLELEMKYMFDSHKKRESQLHRLNAFRETSTEMTTAKEMASKMLATAWTKAIDIKQEISYDKCVSLMNIVMHKMEPSEDDKALCDVLTDAVLSYNGVVEVKNTLLSLLGLEEHST